MQSRQTIDRLELALVELEYARADMAQARSDEGGESAPSDAAGWPAKLKAAEYAVRLCLEALSREYEAETQRRALADRAE